MTLVIIIMFNYMRSRYEFHGQTINCRSTVHLLCYFKSTTNSWFAFFLWHPTVLNVSHMWKLTWKSLDTLWVTSFHTVNLPSLEKNHLQQKRSKFDLYTFDPPLYLWMCQTCGKWLLNHQIPINKDLTKLKTSLLWKSLSTAEA